MTDKITDKTIDTETDVSKEVTPDTPQDEASARPRTKVVVKSIQGLHQKGQRLRDRVFEIGRKMNRNPHRVDCMPDFDEVVDLIDQEEQLTAIKKTMMAAHSQFEWNLYEAKDLLKHLHKIVVAQREIEGM